MRRFLIMLTALVSASISFTTSAAGDYRTYVNERYGYSISYPTSLVPQPISGSGDGRIFNSKTGDAELRVYASTCYESPDEYVAGYEREQKTGNLTVTYSHKGKGYVVVSGLKKGRVFYNKVLISGEGNDLWCTTFTFEYDETASEKYNDVTKRISTSLKAPAL